MDEREEIMNDTIEHIETFLRDIRREQMCREVFVATMRDRRELEEKLQTWQWSYSDES